MIKKVSLLFYAFIACMCMTLIGIKASSVNEIAIQPVYPSNQIEKNGVLNPLVKPGSKQVLSFNIVNLSQSRINMTVSPNTAVTSNGPAIDYSRSIYNYDESLNYSFRSFFKTKKQSVTLEPGKINQVTFVANIPKKSFSGIILGGFYVNTNQDSLNNNSSTAINNKYSYVMPVILKEDKIKHTPKMTLGNVFANNKNNSPVVNSNIYNKKPAVITNLSLDTKITDADGKNIYTNYTSGHGVAPNSHFLLASYISKENLNPGKYHFKTIAKSDEGKWILEKDFNVSISQYLGTILQNNSWIWLLLLLLLLIIIAIIIYLIYRKKKQKKEAASKNLTSDEQK